MRYEVLTVADWCRQSFVILIYLDYYYSAGNLDSLHGRRYTIVLALLIQGLCSFRSGVSKVHELVCHPFSSQRRVILKNRWRKLFEYIRRIYAARTIDKEEYLNSFILITFPSLLTEW